EEPTTAGSHPVIVLALDGLRADALGCYGAPAGTPTFDALAAESIRFEWAFAQAPTMLPSLASLFTGLYPTTHGLREPGDRLAGQAPTMAGVFADAGMVTAAFVEGLPGGDDFGLASGFTSYQTLPAPGEAAVEWMRAHVDDDFLLVVAGWSSPALDTVDRLLGSGAPEGMEERVVEVLTSRGTDSPELFGTEDLEFARSWYSARIQVIDSRLEAFLAEFRRLGLDRRATLIVLGSSGFALQEHKDLFGESLYTPVTRVPLLMRPPGGRGAATVTKIVELVDLMPTIFDLTGQATPPGVQGASLVPIIDGAGTPPYIAFGESPDDGGRRFVALGGMRLISGAGGEGAEIYDLANDPLELDDLAASEEERVGVLVRHLHAWEKMVAAVSLDPELRTEEDLDEDTL
ncbi:MAG: sulfatase, partial [Thermoanaerobaculales bacterium]